MPASASSDPMLNSPTGEHAANTVIVGGGLAGLSATIEAYRAGSHVVLLDKEKNVGGNSAKATSGMNSVHTPAQLAKKIPDSVDKFAADTFKSGGGRSDKLLVKTLTSNAKDAHAWLETFGITLDHISQCGGHGLPRTHRESPRPDGKPAPVGWDIIKVLKAYIDKEIAKKSDPEFGSITILNGAKVHDLIIEDDRVRGVKAKLSGMPFELRSDAVVLATGGFSASPDLLKEFAPHLRHFPTTNGPWASGDGIKFSRALGLSLVDMDKVQLHPTGFIDPANPDANTKFLAPEALRGHGGILLSLGSGTRFANELGTRAAVVDAIHQFSLYPNQTTEDGLWKRGAAFLVLNQAAVDLFDPAVIGFYMARGFFKQVDDGAAGLAALMREGFAGLSAPDATTESVTQTFAEYNAAAQGKVQDKFGKTVFPVTYAPDEKLYVCGITPAIHYTMGGIKINQVGEVLRPKTDKLTIGPEGVPLPGLYAAGEVSGGVHGQNRLAGNSLLECVVFGRIAGQRAAALTKHATLPGLVSDAFTSLTLRSVTSLGHYVKLFRFDLPSSHHTTGLKVGEYVAVRAEIDGEQLVRFYSPISRPDDPGHIDLLIKVDDQGAMSKHIDALVPGVDALEFKGPLGKDFPKLSISKSSPDSGVRRIALIAGGTGISPMIQVIRSMLFHKRSDLQVKLLYGAVAETELVFKDVLIEKAKENNNLKLFFTVDKPNAGWPKPGENAMYGTGYMSAEVLKRELPPPGDDLRVIVCGPWKMCQVLKDTLTEIGYPKGMWYCFM